MQDMPFFIQEQVSPGQITALIEKDKTVYRDSPLPTQEQVLSFFDRLSHAWSEPGSHFRMQAAEVLEKENGLSPAFAAMVLDKFPSLFSADKIKAQIIGEFGDQNIQEEPVLQPSTGVRLRFEGLRSLGSR